MRIATGSARPTCDRQGLLLNLTYWPYL